MTDNPSQPPDGASRVPTAVVYLLYLGALFLPILSIVGVIVAYIYRNDGPDWQRTHHRFQIRTFWIGVLITLVAVAIFLIGLGWILALGWILWHVIRAVKGLRHLQRSEAVPNPDSWLFG
ncbi:MAG: DUF4870 family protein [Magnetovibrionaceae bacterium]